MWSLIFIAFVLILYFETIKKYLRILIFACKLPGPSLAEVLSNEHQKNILAWLIELKNRYPAVFRVWIGNELLVFLSDPDDIKAVLSSNQFLYKTTNREILQPWLGNSLLINGGESWHRRRKMLTPAFHFKILSEFYEPMQANCEILINKLKTVADGKTPVDIYPYVNLFALDVICETAMGIKKHAQNHSDSEYVRAVQRICGLLQEQIFSFWNRFTFIYQFTNSAKELRETLKILHGETRRVIELRRKLLENEADLKLSEIEKDDGVKKRLAFLDMLLLAQKEGATITDKDIQEEVDTFMFAGHDTTSSAITYTIYLLSRHPEIQEKAYREVIELEGREKETMKYLEAVLKESMRIFPVVPALSRRVSFDFKLRDDLVIPKGAAVTVFAYMAQRDPKYYPEPDKFIPERFLDSHDDSAEMHPYSFIPFSAGPRNCIGQRFAMLEMKCCLSNLLKKYEFLPMENYEVKPIMKLVLKSENGIYVKLKKRST